MLSINRRRFLAGGAAAAGLAAIYPAWARSGTAGIAKPLPTVAGTDIALTIHRMTLTADGRTTSAIGINGTVPGPVVRLKEGQDVRLAVTNRLEVDSSIHWHGLLLPPAMDGVPGVSFPGIRPGETFALRIPGQSRTGLTGITATAAARSRWDSTGRS